MVWQTPPDILSPTGSTGIHSSTTRTSRPKLTDCAPRPHYLPIALSATASLEAQNSNNPVKINVYTDGSRSEHGVGSGFTIYEVSSLFYESSHSLPPSATVFQAELSAIFLAAEHILSEIRTLHPRFIKIFIDSRSALQALDSRRVKSSLCLLYTSPSPRDGLLSRMPSSA